MEIQEGMAFSKELPLQVTERVEAVALEGLEAT